jgi:hypothetical protein
MVEPYRCWQDGQLNMLILPDTTHGSYDRVMPEVLGMPRQTPHCFVTELVAVMKQDWRSLKQTLEQRHQQHFLDAIIDHVPAMPTVPPWGTGKQIKWFSEYEFLGNWAMSQHSILTQEQRRFEYDSLDKMGDFTKNYNCFADAIPDLSLSLQLDWQNKTITNFDLYLEQISKCL